MSLLRLLLPLQTLLAFKNSFIQLYNLANFTSEAQSSYTHGEKRQESRLINLQRRDVTKLIPFLVMAIVVEELIPVAAIYAPFMLPSTCILPGQLARIEEKKNLKAVASASEAQGILAKIRKNAVDGTLPISALKGTGSAVVVCGLLRLPTFGNDLLRTWRIRRHLDFLQTDDRMLIQEKAEDSLSDHDVAQALEERGFIIQKLSVKSQRARLKWWLDSIQDTHDDSGTTRRLFLLTEQKP
ncbi:LETM1 and EF-hand domain-containing protein anon- mitochondrial [Lentinula edodes]|uniref:LETM1 and EF-hand domain-containing protein anon-mitochondrial n=1 Tax=Lentinula edodes TaxID=5353 RepID=A0A1Q3E3G9_LENED|nr:LETM1 and EF-hand domain-containing protein anon- mitochondrial [Lentinula edodes]